MKHHHNLLCYCGIDYEKYNNLLTDFRHNLIILEPCSYSLDTHLPEMVLLKYNYMVYV